MVWLDEVEDDLGIARASPRTSISTLRRRSAEEPRVKLGKLIRKEG
jgi:hypothetical protein